MKQIYQLADKQSTFGTISTVDGQFEISVPPDTLEFFHVSYQTAMGKMEHLPVNIDVAVKGLEYQ